MWGPRSLERSVSGNAVGKEMVLKAWGSEEITERERWCREREEAGVQLRDMVSS